MITFKPKFPEEKMTSLCQLEIFFDYVLHGIADSGTVKYPFKYNKSVAKYIHDENKVVVDVCFDTIYHETVKDFMKYFDVLSVALYVGGHFVKPISVSIHVAENVENKEEFNMMPANCMPVVGVEKIIHRKSDRGEFFTVVWTDHTITTVKRAEGEVSDEYSAFCYALGKKIFNDKGTAREFIAEKKKVFEDEVAKKSEAKKHRIRAKAMQKQYEAECEDDEVIKAFVYEEGFVPPCLISKGLFRRNK